MKAGGSICNAKIALEGVSKVFQVVPFGNLVTDADIVRDDCMVAKLAS